MKEDAKGLLTVIGTGLEDKRIYVGKIDPETSKWVGDRMDVTNEAIEAVGQHLLETQRDCCLHLTNGQYLVVNAVLYDELPERFEPEKKGPVLLEHKKKV